MVDLTKAAHSKDLRKKTLHTGNPAKEEFLRRTDEAAAWEEKFDLLGEHYRRYL